MVSKQYHTYDYWWHIKAGEYIVQNKSIPYNDVFSWFGIQENLHWYSHEWLSEIFIFIFSTIKCGGYIFILFFTLLLFFLLYILNKNDYINNYLFTSIWIIIGGVIFFYVIAPRPHMISFILLVITISILIKYKNNENLKTIWFIPIVSFLWANFHGGSSNLPYVLTFIILITGLFEFRVNKLKGKKLTLTQIKTLIIIIIASILAICINPHGFDMIFYPYENMNDSYMLSIISEWRCPDLKNIGDYYIFGEIAIIIFAFIFTKEDILLEDFVLNGAFIYLSLKSVRFSALLYIISTFTIFKYVYFKEHLLTLNLDKIMIRLITLIGGLCVLFYIMVAPTILKEPLAKNIPENVIELIKKENPKKLYNDYDFGGYLIYKDIKVFVDGRADLYSRYNLKDAINLSALNGSPNEIINKYKFDLFVIKNDCPLAYYLNDNSNYTKLIEDNDSKMVVFKPIKKNP